MNDSVSLTDFAFPMFDLQNVSETSIPLKAYAYRSKKLRRYKSVRMGIRLQYRLVHVRNSS